LESSKSLRSAVARNALLCLSEMFPTVGPSIAPCVEDVVPVLLGRVVNDKKFIRQAARDCLQNMTTHLAQRTTLECLLQFSQEKSGPLIAAAAEYTTLCMDTMGAAVRDCSVDRLIVNVNRYNTSKSPEAHTFAGKMIRSAMLHIGFDAIETTARLHLSHVDAEAILRLAKMTPRAQSTRRTDFMSQVRAAKSAARAPATVPVMAEPLPL